MLRKDGMHGKGTPLFLKSREAAGLTIWSSEYRFMADALELPDEEGRDKLRKAGGRSTYPVIPGYPNGVIQYLRRYYPMHEYIVQGRHTA